MDACAGEGEDRSESQGYCMATCAGLLPICCPGQAATGQLCCGIQPGTLAQAKQVYKRAGRQAGRPGSSHLQGADGVDLADDDASAGGLQGGGAALAHITVAGHKGGLARNHDVCLAKEREQGARRCR